MTTKGSHRGTLLCILLLIVAGLFLLYPLFKPGFFLSDDGEWMIIRLSAFFQSLRDGQVPVRFLGRLNHVYGYPVANFLYPGFLYIGSVIHALGFSFVDSVKIILAGSVMGSSVLAFLWLRVYFSSFAGLFGALSFLFAPYLVFDLYTRGSVGEIFALLPATASFYAIASKKYWLLAPAAALLIVGHNSLALLFFPYIILYLLSQRQPYRLWHLVLSLGMAAFFWIPAIVERQYVQFDLVSVSKFSEYFLKGGDLILLGPLFLLGFVGLFLKKQVPEVGRLHAGVFTCASFMALSMSAVVWNILPIAPIVQFPYRFLAVALVAGSYLVAALVDRRPLRFQLGFLVVAVFVWLVTVVPRVVSVPRVDRENGYYTTNEATTTVADEYMPRWVRVKPTQRTLSKLSIVKGLGAATLTRLSTRRLEAHVTLQTYSTIQLSLIYYPGWGVLVDDVPVPIRYANERGLVEFDVPEGSHRIVAAFRETPLRLLADALSVASAIGYVAWLVISRKKKTLA